MATRLNYSGLVIAGVGFFLTRFTVTLAIYEDPVRFLLAGIVPLVLGLGLAAFGVALAVADVDASLVRTTAAWCVVGTGTMLVLVVLTLLGSTAGEMPVLAAARSQSYLSNFLIGGSVGGTLTGLYASRDRRQRRELRHHANRLEVLNRLLRHEVLNAVTVIKGYASLGDVDEARGVIESRSADIEQTIEEVKYLTRRTRSNRQPRVRVNLGSCLEASLASVAAEHPETEVTVDAPPDDLTVLADDRLELVFTHLLENAVVHTPDDATVEVSVEAGANRVGVSVRDEGTGLPEDQRQLLKTGEIERFDDPRTGFGLNVVRLFVEGYRGAIETDVDDGGTTITVSLPRARAEAPGLQASPAELSPVRPAIPHLVVTLAAALVAGVFYGLASVLLGGSIAGIGVFYGTANPLVGWITHEFHSAVFGFVFLGLVTLAPNRDRPGVHVAIGVGWALTLWVVAAGFIAPVWLRLLGIPAPIPNISGTLLASHLVWGLSLGLLTAWGFEHVSPWLARLGERVAAGGWR